MTKIASFIHSNEGQGRAEWIQAIPRKTLAYARDYGYNGGAVLSLS